MNIEKIIEEAKRSVVHFKAHTAPGPLTVFTDKRARFARFSLQGKGVLHLTEIEIYTDDDVNVALRKPVTTSSMFGDDKRWLGSRVVDGKTSGPLGIHTKQENDPWVRIGGYRRSVTSAGNPVRPVSSSTELWPPQGPWCGRPRDRR